MYLISLKIQAQTHWYFVPEMDSKALDDASALNKDSATLARAEHWRWNQLRHKGNISLSLSLLSINYN